MKAASNKRVRLSGKGRANTAKEKAKTRFAMKAKRGQRNKPKGLDK